MIWDQPDMLPCDAVGFDGEAGVYRATRHLIDSGHRDIRFLMPGWFDRDNLPYWVRERLQGFRRAFTAAGLSDAMPYDIMWGKVDDTGVEFADATALDDMRSVGEGLWKRMKDTGLPSAVVAVNDELARAFVVAARADDASIPGDLSVIGFDDRFDSASFGLSTVHIPLQEIGETATSLLMEQIQSTSDTQTNPRYINTHASTAQDNVIRDLSNNQPRTILCEWLQEIVLVAVIAIFVAILIL